MRPIAFLLLSLAALPAFGEEEVILLRLLARDVGRLLSRGEAVARAFGI